MTKHKIYIAGPLGFSMFGRLAQARVVDILTRAGFEPIDPFQSIDPAIIHRAEAIPTVEARSKALAKINRRIGAANQRDIDASAAVLAVLDGSDVDSGTAAEIGYAFARGKPIVGYRDDFRLAGDNPGAIVNLQVEHFILSSPGGAIVFDLVDIVKKLRVALRKANGR